jgi:hypothetical protein
VSVSVQRRNRGRGLVGLTAVAYPLQGEERMNCNLVGLMVRYRLRRSLCLWGSLWPSSALPECSVEHWNCRMT